MMQGTMILGIMMQGIMIQGIMIPGIKKQGAMLQGIMMQGTMKQRIMIQRTMTQGIMKLYMTCLKLGCHLILFFRQYCRPFDLGRTTLSTCNINVKTKKSCSVIMNLYHL